MSRVYPCAIFLNLSPLWEPNSSFSLFHFSETRLNRSSSFVNCFTFSEFRWWDCNNTEISVFLCWYDFILLLISSICFIKDSSWFVLITPGLFASWVLNLFSLSISVALQMLSRRERSANCSRSRVIHSGDRDKSSGKSSDERRKAEVRLKSEIHTFMFCFSVSISCKSRLSSSSFAADIPFRCSCFPAISFNVFRESSSCVETSCFRFS